VDVEAGQQQHIATPPSASPTVDNRGGRGPQAPSLRLIPPGITWEQFCDFTSGLENVQDSNVSERYAYGEIRLSRLNLYAPFLLGKSHFHRVEYQYAAYFANYVASMLFCIGIASVVLSGLHVT
jgi:hypothetical protein